MSDFEHIQRLIRLKRHEQPSEDFVEDFVSRFQQRQRVELMQQSARGLLWERLTTHFEGLLSPKWVWAGASAMAVAVAFFGLKPGAPQGDGLAVNGKAEASAVHDPISDTEVERYLISRHYDGGLADEHANNLLAQDPVFVMPPAAPQAGGLLPAGFKRDLDVK